MRFFAEIIEGWPCSEVRTLHLRMKAFFLIISLGYSSEELEIPNFISGISAMGIVLL